MLRPAQMLSFKKKALVGDFFKYWTTSSNISKHPLHVWFRVTYVWYHLRLVLPPLSRGYCSGWERERLQHCSCSGVTNPADWDLHLITSTSPSCIQPPSTDQHLLLHKLVRHDDGLGLAEIVVTCHDNDHPDDGSLHGV